MVCIYRKLLLSYLKWYVCVRNILCIDLKWYVCIMKYKFLLIWKDFYVSYDFIYLTVYVFVVK